MSLCDKRALSGQAGEKIPLWTNMTKDPEVGKRLERTNMTKDPAVGKQAKRAQWAK